ncbi:Uncharacterised protein [uncultured archaeon]|nr:Uncharacterised protein [uncultured archaeon]
MGPGGQSMDVGAAGGGDCTLKSEVSGAALLPPLSLTCTVSRRLPGGRLEGQLG